MFWFHFFWLYSGHVSINFRLLKICFYVNFDFVSAKALECYRCPYYGSLPNYDDTNYNCMKDVKDKGVVVTCPDIPYSKEMACYSHSIGRIFTLHPIKFKIKMLHLWYSEIVFTLF